MASNFFGQLFRITTFGESHGPAIGVVIDGCPAGLDLSLEEIEQELALRSPGQNSYTSPRKEEDLAEILSGVFEGKTTGAPIAILVRNKDADSSQYDSIKGLYRPGHANFTYLEKYGIFDYRGGGRSSARETVARVAAGAVAKKLLRHFGIQCVAYLAEAGGIGVEQKDFPDLAELQKSVRESPIFCPDPKAEIAIKDRIRKVQQAQDSIGGIIACIAHLPAGLGDPVYGKLEALLAYAMLSLPATKAFEIGSGVQAARLKGSEHNDAFNVDEKGKVFTKTNHAGGTLGGISTGSSLTFQVAFKPTSSIKKPQETVSLSGEKATFQLDPAGRHDPCVAIRAVPIVEAMTAITLADAFLLNRSSRL
jgi:chorismate synthase